MSTKSNPQLSTLLQQIHSLKTEFLPLPEHGASACDTHTKERYLTLLASLAMADKAISEAESRLISLLRTSMGLEVRNSALYEQAGNLDEEGLKDFFRAIKEADIAKSFILDALILCRLDGPLNPDAAEVLGHLTELMVLGEEDLKALVGLSGHVLGIEGCSFIPVSWKTDFFYHWLPLLLKGSGMLTLQDIEVNQSIASLKPSNIISATVRDKVTGLEWMRCSMGQTWDGNTCTGEPKSYTWDQAIAAAKKLNEDGGYNGYKDWRVPTIEELSTLVYCSSTQRKIIESGYRGLICEGSCQNPTINLKAFSNFKGRWYWSFTDIANNLNQACAIDFNDSEIKEVAKSSGNQLRLVRAGQ